MKAAPRRSEALARAQGRHVVPAIRHGRDVARCRAPASVLLAFLFLLLDQVAEELGVVALFGGLLRGLAGLVALGLGLALGGLLVGLCGTIGDLLALLGRVGAARCALVRGGLLRGGRLGGLGLGLLLAARLGGGGFVEA